MTGSLKRSVLSGVAAIALLATGAAAAQDVEDLSLRRVMLSTGGVGYFEHEATVTGTADLSLQVRLDQVNDVLKSIVVYDDEGGVGDISLPGQEPLREVFREMPFGPEALSSPAALFNALRGAEVESVGARSVAGRILSVTQENTALPDGGAITRHRLSLMTDDGLRQLILEEADALQFTDPELQAAVGEALEALSRHNERDRRDLAVRMIGEGDRTVRVAYVVEAPLWKSSYRLTLSDDQTGDAGDLLGWAVLENMSGEAWEDVELTVVSGNPVTFTQALYTAYYVDRPEIPVEVLGRVMPRLDEGAVDRAEAETMLAARAQLAPPPAPAPSMDMAAGALMMMESEYADFPPTPEQAQVRAAESQDATTQVVFRVPEPISVESGHSLLVPIVAEAIPLERVSVYQPDTHPTHPLASVRLVNDGDVGLPPGVLTLYERSSDSGQVTYVGDARLAALPAGDDRMISFAVDQKVRIDRQITGDRAVSRSSIADGVLRLQVTEEQRTTYTVEGAAREPRTVILEHPRSGGDWRMVSPVAEDEAEVTDTHYRIPVEVAAGETVTIDVVIERPQTERVILSDLNLGQVGFYANSTELSPEVRQAIADMRGHLTTLADLQERLSTLNASVSVIVSEQGRIRDNLRAVPEDSDLYQRYLATLSGQEDELLALRTAIEDTQAERQAAREALRTYVNGLRL